MEAEKLATLKRGAISDEEVFLRSAKENFTEYNQPLISCINKLRKAVFSDGKTRSKEEPGLHDRRREILWSAQRGLRGVENSWFCCIGAITEEAGIDTREIYSSVIMGIVIER